MNVNDAPTGAGKEAIRMPKHKQPMTAQQELFFRLSAQGKTRPEIFKAVFDVDLKNTDLTDKEIHNIDAKLSRWRQMPEFETIWKDEVKSILYGCTSEAIQVIRGQLRRNDQLWLQNKAANDLLNYGKSQIYGDEERTVHVQIDGLPDIGSPDDD